MFGRLRFIIELSGMERKCLRLSIGDNVKIGAQVTSKGT